MSAEKVRRSVSLQKTPARDSKRGKFHDWLALEWPACSALNLES